MYRKVIVLFTALAVVVGIILGVRAVLAQETADGYVPETVPGSPAFRWQRDGEQSASPIGPGYGWRWQQDGEQSTPPFGRGHMRRWQGDGEAWPGPHGPGFGGDPLLADGNRLPDIVAQMLGLSVEEVVAELNRGISIAELAGEHGVEVDAIIAAVSDAHAQALQEAVEDGRLTREQADWMQQQMAAMIAVRVERPWGAGYGPGGCHFEDEGAPARGSWFGPRRHGGMRGGWEGGWQRAPVVPQGPGA